MYGSKVISVFSKSKKSIMADLGEIGGKWAKFQIAISQERQGVGK